MPAGFKYYLTSERVENNSPEMGENEALSWNDNARYDPNHGNGS